MFFESSQAPGLHHRRAERPCDGEQEESRQKDAERPREQQEQPGQGEQDLERPVERPQRERTRRQPKKVEST